jgi:flavin reductase (DIM6/NTAB) family NADH-FMN oxidoreductase RutF
VDRRTFRALLGSLVTAVSVVTTLGPDGRPRGFTCSSVCSVSADPPMLLAGVSSVSGTLEAIRHGRRFVVNMLSSQGRHLSDLFASDSGSKFARVCWEPGKHTGMPVLEATVAHTECVLERTVEAGDHHLVLGRVVGGTAETERTPLAYWRGSYGQLVHTARRSREEEE